MPRPLKRPAEQQNNILSLDRALARRRRVDAAIGVVMTRYRVSYDDASTVVRLESRRTNRRLALVAEIIVHLGHLPGDDGADGPDAA